MGAPESTPEDTCPLCGGKNIVPLTVKKCWMWACRDCKKCWDRDLWDALMRPAQKMLEDF